MDPTRLFVAGSSTGANLVGVCAFTPNDPKFQPGFEHADTETTGAVLLYGYYGHYFGELPLQPHSLLHPQVHFTGHAPPLFIADGTSDG